MYIHTVIIDVSGNNELDSNSLLEIICTDKRIQMKFVFDTHRFCHSRFTRVMCAKRINIDKVVFDYDRSRR